MRVQLELRIRLENDVILIQLCVHRVDLALPEGVVERVVDGGRCDAEARSGSTVNGQRCRLSAELLVCHDVGDFG